MVPIDLPNRPAWLKEKVNPANKVPFIFMINPYKLINVLSKVTIEDSKRL